MKITFSGVSQLAFFLIPLALALGALYWLLFVSQARIFIRTVSQDQRHAEIVGAKVLPKTPMEIEIRDSRDAALKIERAEIDNGDLWAYYRNTGAGSTSYIKLEWSLIAPDGTVIKSGGGYVDVYSKNDAPGALEAGERGEAHYKIPSDPRAVKLRLKISGN